MAATRGNHAFLDRGFTLVELILVIAILGIILGITLPSLKHAHRSRELDTLVSNFVVTFQLCRKQALYEKTDMIMELSGSGYSVYRGIDKSAKDKAVSLPSGVIMEGDTRQMRFYADGSNDDATVIWKSGDQVRKVMIKNDSIQVENNAQI